MDMVISNEVTIIGFSFRNKVVTRFVSAVPLWASVFPLRVSGCPPRVSITHRLVLVVPPPLPVEYTLSWVVRNGSWIVFTLSRVVGYRARVVRSGSWVGVRVGVGVQSDQFLVRGLFAPLHGLLVMVHGLLAVVRGLFAPFHGLFEAGCSHPFVGCWQWFASCSHPFAGCSQLLRGFFVVACGLLCGAFMLVLDCFNHNNIYCQECYGCLIH